MKHIGLAMIPRNMITQTLLTEDCVFERCGSCGLASRIDRDKLSIKIPKSKQRFDLVASHDLARLFSPRLVSLLTKHCRNHCPAFKVVSDTGFAVLHDSEVLSFDQSAPGYEVQKEQLCSGCGRYLYQVRALPVRLTVGSIEPNGFYRTDLEFGSNDSKSPIHFVGHALCQTLIDEKVQGIDWMDVITRF